VLVFGADAFAEELAEREQASPPKKIQPGKREWNGQGVGRQHDHKMEPGKYHDDYREALMEVIEEKVESVEKR